MEFKDGQEQKKIFFKKTGKELDYYYFKYRPKLIWNLMQRSKDSVIAEEVSDEAILKAFFEIEKFDSSKSNFTTWLFTIGKNLMSQRMKDNTKTASIDDYVGSSGDSVGEDAVKIIDQLSDISCDEKLNEEYDHILTAKIKLVITEMSQLPDKYRTVLQMRELDGMSYESISDVLNLNLNTIKSQIKQGRILLAKQLKPKFQEIEEDGISDFYYY